jgi:hypothetical protein
MDDDLSYLSAAIADFRGYGDEPDRRATDGRVRALLGEALAGLRARLDGSLSPTLGERLDAAVLRCQFADQRYVAALEGREIQSGEMTVLARADRGLVESANGLATLESAGLPARLDQIMALLDRRSTPLG